jgi:hypothetical protein
MSNEEERARHWKQRAESAERELVAARRVIAIVQDDGHSYSAVHATNCRGCMLGNALANYAAAKGEG